MITLVTSFVLFGYSHVALASSPSVWWGTSSDPVLNVSAWSTKDATMGYDGSSGSYLLAFSAFYDDLDPNSGKTETISHVVGVLTKDFAPPYGQAVLNISGHDQKWKGMCSPNFYEAPAEAPLPANAKGKYIVTLNSWGDIDGRPNQLFYTTSADLRSWAPYAPLAASRTAGIRAIDAAVAWLPVASADGGSTHQWVLAYKDKEQTTRFGVSPALDGNFTDPLRGGLPTFAYSDGKISSAIHENFEFFTGPDGRLRLVTSDYGTGTSGRETWIYTQSEEGSLAAWEGGHLVPVDTQSFNKDDNSNAGYIADWRDLGVRAAEEVEVAGSSDSGYYYMVWAGNNDHGSFSGRGHNELGLARSADLQHWETLREGR